MAKPTRRSGASWRRESRHISPGYFVGGLALAIGATLIGALFENFPMESRTLAMLVAALLLSSLGNSLLKRMSPLLRNSSASQTRAGERPKCSKELKAFPRPSESRSRFAERDRYARICA